jgi:hypothetical protein
MHITTLIKFLSVTDVGRKTGVDRSSIGKCCNGKSKSAGGYTWKYI